MKIEYLEINAEDVANCDEKHDYNTEPFPCVISSRQKANMIATAPDLLAALKEILWQYCSTDDGNELVKYARAAIAKAEGLECRSRALQ